MCYSTMVEGSWREVGLVPTTFTALYGHWAGVDHVRRDDMTPSI